MDSVGSSQNKKGRGRDGLGWGRVWVERIKKKVIIIIIIIREHILGSTVMLFFYFLKKNSN